MPETMKGKKHALAKLAERREQNASRERKDNSTLPAGSPMYYDCKACGEEIAMPEGHIGPPPPLCNECQALKDCGWLE